MLDDRPSPSPRTRPLLALALGVLAVLVALGPTAGAQDAAAPSEAVPVVHLDGRGHGHGVGMSQWGAYTMAADGLAAADILARFYPGTALGTATGEVAVVVASGGSVRVALPAGGELRSSRGGPQAEGFPIALAPGEVAEIVHDGTGYRVLRGEVRALSSRRQRFSPGGGVGPAQEDCLVLCPEPEPEPEPQPEPEPEPEPCLVCTTTTTAPPAQDPSEPEDPTPAPTPAPGPDAPAPTPAPSPEPEPAPAPPPDAPRASTPIWAVPAQGTVTAVDRGRTYRGVAEILGTPGEVRLRNHVDVEDYLKGMAEVPGTWPAAAVQAQAVAARTYAMRAMAAGGELCDSESCQVYAGIGHETPGQVAAVDATRGWVVTYGGRLAATFYSASGGGFSANVEEGFGSDHDVPYLPAQPYETANPKLWQLDVALTDVGARLGYPGTVTDLRVSAVGPSGRPVAMVVDGDAGTLDVDPQDVRRRLGLPSTFFTAEIDLAEAPPPPPPPVDADQLTTAPGTESAGDTDLDVALLVDEVEAETAAGALGTGAGDLPVGTLGALAVLLAAAATAAGLHRTSRAALLAGLVPVDARHGLAAMMVSWSPPRPTRIRLRPKR